MRHTMKPEEETSPRTSEHTGTQRLVIFSSLSDWERKKKLYVHSVMRHMKENQEAHHGVVSELLRMMNHVADESGGRDGRRWQHPSDLTRRNYRSRFGAQLETTLREWQHNNYGAHKRFLKVPELFERSCCP